jgi:hypothetical protein
LAGRLWAVLSDSVWFWPVLAGSGWFWPILSGSIWFWPVLAGFVRFWLLLAGSVWVWPVRTGGRDEHLYRTQCGCVDFPSRLFVLSDFSFTLNLEDHTDEDSKNKI